MTEIYLAVWKDRHTDDRYRAFYNLDDAIKQCKKWKKEYAGYGYRFYRRDIRGTIFFATEYGDPSFIVEKVELS